MKENARPDQMVMLFNALADPTRLRLLNLMRDGEICVCYFVEILKEAQPKISRHLAYLRRAGIVHTRREGKWMHYGITRPAQTVMAQILDDVLTWMRNDPVMVKDRSKLVNVCCTLSKPAQLQGAPLPALSHTS